MVEFLVRLPILLSGVEPSREFEWKQQYLDSIKESRVLPATILPIPHDVFRETHANDYLGFERRRIL